MKKFVITLCHEERCAAIITVNGRDDTAILGLQDYYQMKSELELLRTLAEAEEQLREIIFYIADDSGNMAVYKKCSPYKN